jgi:hypothetical protein
VEREERRRLALELEDAKLQQRESVSLHRELYVYTGNV